MKWQWSISCRGRRKRLSICRSRLVSCQAGTQLIVDGSKVEVKTPDGTRVATPSQNPAASAALSSAGPSSAPAGSGAATPRTASYAGAVKTAPSDWHLEFSLNGKPLSLNDTIYGAVHRSQSTQSGASSGGAGVFGGSVVFKFKRVDGPAPTGE
jgi:E3 ubiquitin-protein ligase TRIP12